jgi:NAD(P)H-dependent FMN reductase
MVAIDVLTGSVRPGRFNVQPAHWIYGLLKERDGVKAGLIDLAEVNLPFLDEAVPASRHQYANEHTKRWAETVGAADGFVFVTPEYNHSISPVLKNAIDYLWLEWNYKPVGYVSYGSMAGGARAVEHLRAIAGETKMYDIRDQVVIPNYWERLDDHGNYHFSEREEKTAAAMLDDLVFWSGVMKVAREHRGEAARQGSRPVHA